MSVPDTRTVDEFARDLEQVLSGFVPFLSAKRRAYGTTNLTRFGPMGIVIRMSDKIDRLVNRFRDGTDAVGGADVDTVLDSWRDLVGYAVLGYMEHIREHGEPRE